MGAGATSCSRGDGVLLIQRKMEPGHEGERKERKEKGHKVREAVAGDGSSGDRPTGREVSSC